jgi:hypothetical protein
MKEQEITAIVLMVNDRYYYNHTKKRIATAWCLAGAKLFMPHGNLSKILEAEEALTSKGYKVIRKSVYVGMTL